MSLLQIKLYIYHNKSFITILNLYVFLLEIFILFIYNIINLISFLLIIYITK